MSNVQSGTLKKFNQGAIPFGRKKVRRERKRGGKRNKECSRLDDE